MKANEITAKIIRVVDDLDKAGENIPCLIMSHPGAGKTTTVKMYCDVMDYNLVTLIPSQQSSDDVLGLQSIDPKTGKLSRLTPSWFNKLKKVMENGKRTILFIDEITTCDPYIQGPLLDLIFSRNLGEDNLPDNCFIVSAGNYSEDLNNEFKMSAPLINRFLIVNLQNDDFSIKEVLSGAIRNCKTTEEKSKFLGFEGSRKKEKYDFNKFSEWVLNSKEVKFGKSYAEEVEGYGLLGFTSVRSITYALKFAEQYMNTFLDKDWIRVVGDTLGSSNKRDTGSAGTGIPMRDVINSDASLFLVASFKDKGSSENETFEDICKNMKKNGVTVAYLRKAEEYIESHPSDTANCAEMFGELGNSISSVDLNDPEKKPIIVNILNLLKKRMY